MAERELRTQPDPIRVQLQFTTDGTAVTIDIDRHRTLSEIRRVLQRHLPQFTDGQFCFLLLDGDTVSREDEERINVQPNIAVLR